MERRGRIPVAKFRTQEGKTRSRSRVREPDYNEQDPETDLFTLLEDNIALKEENKALKLQLEDRKFVYIHISLRMCRIVFTMFFYFFQIKKYKMNCWKTIQSLQKNWKT